MRFWIDGHGCAKNQVDGEEIAARFESAGHSWVDSPAYADLIIVNTCGFIEEAKKESLEAVISLKAAWPAARVLVAGCLSQRYAGDLAAELSEADGILGNADLSAALEAAERTMAGERPIVVPPIPAASTASFSSPPRRGRLFDFPGTAHVKITEGCSNRCSYCAIPLIRGGLRSRPVREILAECGELVARGIRELVLIGQDLGSFGRDLPASGEGADGPSLLPSLLAGLSAIEGDFRVRVLYIHPDNFPEAILPLIKGDSRLLPYFDIPFQHASRRILAAMNRRGDSGTYLGLIGRIREALPDAVLRSTFLLGFPGETDEDFDTLRDFQERAAIDWLGAFAYSREEGTPAYSMKGRVAKKTVAARKKAIEEAQERITGERMRRFVGRELDVLVEERVEGEELSLGRAWLQASDVDGLTVLRGSHEPGSLLRARVLAANGIDLDAAPTGDGPGRRGV